MTEANQPPRRLRFGVFEADIRTGELTKLGKRVRLQEQPFQLLASFSTNRGNWLPARNCAIGSGHRPSSTLITASIKQ
jgi:hypothetical protein